MKIRYVLLLLVLISCNNQKDRNNREDSLINVIDSLKKPSENNFQQNNATQSQKKFAFVIINYIRGYEYYYEFEEKYKKLREEDGNYKSGDWVKKIDTIVSMSTIKEYEHFNTDTEYKMLDEAEKSLPLSPIKNERNIVILKIILRKANIFDTYSEASKAQEDFKQKLEERRIENFKNGN